MSKACRSVRLCPCVVASAHLDGKERSARRPCLCATPSTVLLLCAPTAPPASRYQAATPASVLWEAQGCTARKVMPRKHTSVVACVCDLHIVVLSRVSSAVAISDPFFSGNQSSWMSFPPVRMRHRTVLQLQFQPLSADGILVYTAQHLGVRAGEDI